MRTMQNFTSFTVLLIAIGLSSAFIFDGLFEQSSGCTVLAEVPLTPADPYFKAEWLPNLNAKLAANQDRYNRNLRQVWVDAPIPSICGYATFNQGGRCCMNGHFPPEYKWLVFRSGEKKKMANEQLWAEAQVRQLPYYKVYVDAPERYCKRTFGGLDDLLG